MSDLVENPEDRFSHDTAYIRCLESQSYFYERESATKLGVISRVSDVCIENCMEFNLVCLGKSEVNCK